MTPCSEEGKEYEFRVFSENEIGESEPLQTARPFLAKNQYSKSVSSIKDVSSVSSVAWIKYVQQSLLCYGKESIDVAQLPCRVGGKDKQNAKVKCIKATQINFENNLNVELS